MFRWFRTHDLDAVVATVLAREDPRVEAALAELTRASPRPEVALDVAAARVERERAA